jgi:hypothetical protein
MNGADAGLRPKSSSCKLDGRSPLDLCDAPLASAGNPKDGSKAKARSAIHEFFSASRAIKAAFSSRRFAGITATSLRDRGRLHARRKNHKLAALRRGRYFHRE